MDDSAKSALTGIALIAAVAAVAWAMRNQAAAPLPETGAGGFVTGETRFRDVRITGRVGNAKGWTVRAEQVQTDSQGNRVVFSDGISALLYQGGVLRVTCEAPRATFSAVNDLLVAEGGVQATIMPPAVDDSADMPVNLGPIRLATDLLRWTAGSRTLSCPGPVEMTLDRGRIDVDSLDFDLAARDLDARGFRGRFRVQENDL